jgi:hypothetical protein
MQTRLLNQTHRWLLALAGVGLLAGCAQLPQAQPDNQWQATESDSQGLPQPVQQFLDGATEQSTQAFDESPWGKQAEVTVQQHYFAGSGRPCVRLKVSTAQARSETAIACHQNDQWVSVRPVTQLVNAQ